MKYALLALAIFSGSAFAHTEIAIRSYGESTISNQADGCPDGYKTDDGKRTSDCKREVKCTKNMGMGQINQLERDSKGQIFQHSYTVDFICQPDGNYKRVVKRLN